MKKLSLIIITAFLAVSSYGQGGGTWTVCNHPCPPPLGATCPNQCWKLTIINDLTCDLDFWFDYTLTHPCGDIVPAWDNLGGPTSNLVVANSSKDLFAYELDWPCEPNSPICACPSHLKFRVGNPNIALLDPFVIEPWPILSSWSSGSSVTYVTTILCGTTPINIYINVTAPGVATIRFY